MSPIIKNNWVGLLGDDPRLTPDIQFRVTEELSFEGTKTERPRTELIGAHKFVLAMASDVFKDQFSVLVQEEAAVISLTGFSIEVFKEFLKLLYSLFLSNWKECKVKAEYSTEILKLCKKYKVEDAISFIQNRLKSVKMEEGGIKQEFLTVPKVNEPSNIRKFEEDDTKVVKTELYCILCQEYGHLVSEKCVSSAICLACDKKGHTRRDCREVKSEIKKYESEEIENESTEMDEEYIEMEEADNDLKTEVTLEPVRNMPKDSAQKVNGTQSVKMCSVSLRKVKIKKTSDTCLVSSRGKCGNKTEGKIKSKFYLRRHTEAEHEGIRYPCQECDHKAKFSYGLKEHMRVKHERVIYSCEKCDFKTKYKSHLKIHIEALHEGIRFPCQKCNFTAKYRRHLDEHIQAQHEGVTYSCENCDYTSKWRCNLSNHIKGEHEGLRYFCEKCDYKTKRKYELSMHIKVQHEGFRYFCEECDCETKFKSKSHLRWHMKTEH